MDEMTLYHDCWYWGCDEVCNDRHTINTVMAYASACVSVIYLVLAIISGVQSEFDYKEVPVQVQGIPTVKLDDIPIKQIEIPVIEDQGSPTISSSDNSGLTSSGSSKSWNFSLRM